MMDRDYTNDDAPRVVKVLGVGAGAMLLRPDQIVGIEPAPHEAGNSVCLVSARGFTWRIYGERDELAARLGFKL